MIRLSLLTLFIGFLCVYSFKDWYRAVCGLILLMAVVEHPDMPKSMLGIQGLNPWNITLFVILIAWMTSRRKENLRFDLPPRFIFLLTTYLFFIVVSFIRLVLDQDELQEWFTMAGGEEEGFASMLSEYIINCIKWVIPGLLLYDGCRSRERVLWGSISILLVYFLLAIQVIKWMPLSGLATGGDLEARSLKILVNEIGYHRVNMAMLLSGGFWAMFAFRDLVPDPKYNKYVYLCCGVIFMGLALTAGRTGYATWAVIGFILIMMKWRKLLLLAPVPIILVLIFVPAVWERMSAGFGGKNVDINSAIESTHYAGGGEPSWYTVTSGRIIAWPLVLEKIAEGPFIGYGREAMIRTGLSKDLMQNYNESFPHPHNAYLQWMLDNGLIGFIPVFVFYFLMFKYSFRMFRDRENPIVYGTGGISLALLLALLVAGVGSQSFYPREGAVGMWAAMGLMLRVYLDRYGWVSEALHPHSRTDSRTGSRTDARTDSRAGSRTEQKPSGAVPATPKPLWHNLKAH